jgi:hypothetical protein
MVKYRILATDAQSHFWLGEDDDDMGDLGDSGDQGPAWLALGGVVGEDSGDNISLVGRESRG